jgi:hypothetical protein
MIGNIWQISRQKPPLPQNHVGATMPNNGIIFKTTAIEWHVKSTLNSATGAGSGTLAKSHSATAITQWVPNAINVNTGIYLEVSSSDDGAGTVAWQAKYDGAGAPAGGYIVGAPAFRNDVEIRVRATGFKIYCKLTGSLLRVMWDSLMVFVNGALSTTLSGVDYTSNGTGANYVNDVGIPLYASGSCSASKVFTPPAYDPCNPGASAYMTEATATSTINAGWRFQDQDNNWTALPCAIWTASIPTSGSCPYNLSFDNEVTVDDTDSIEIHCRSYAKTQKTYDGRRTLTQHVVGECVGEDGGTIVYDEYVTGYCLDPCTDEYDDGYIDAYYLESWAESHGGTARAIPNLERAIYRINGDYKALWRRFDFPEVRGSATRSCTNGAVTVNTGGETVVYTDLGTDFLEVVTNATSNVEQAFPNTIYTQHGMSKTKSYSKTWSYEGGTVCLCPPPSVPIPSCPEGEVLVWTCTNVPQTDVGTNQSESINRHFPSYVGSLAGYQGHADMLCRYTGSWVNPHWNIAYHRQDWDVDGAPVDNDLYWSAIKEQYLYNSALPSSPRTRNSMIACPLYWDNGNQPFQDAFFGKFRWIGISRWQTLVASPPSTLTLSQTRSGNWTGTNCTATVGAGGITVSAFTGTNHYVDLDMGNWAVDPYLLLLKAHEVIVNWSATNVSEIQVSWIGQDNTSNYFGNSTGTYNLPTGIQTKYAGTWAIDNGASLVTDTGTDTLPNGVSATYMSDPELSVNFELGRGRMFAKLRFTIVPTNPANNVTINFPTFNLRHTHPMMYWENSKYLSMLWHNSMNIRWGNLQWYSTVLGFMNPPITAGMDVPSTVIDALAFNYRVINGTGGTNLASTITSDLSTLYDAYEGQSISVVDKFSNSFILPKGNGHDIRYALVNSFSELPPFACFPTRKRNTNTWLPTGTYAQVVYDHVQDGRYLISNTSASAKLQTDAGVDSGSVLSPGEPGWYIWKFNPTLYNNEVDWQVVAGGKTWAHVRPWHGWYCLLRSTNCRTSMDIDFASNQHVSAYVLNNGNVQIRTADNTLTWSTVNTLGINAQSACIKIDRQSNNQTIYMVAEVNGSIKLYTADKPEEAFTMARTIANGVKPFIVIGRDGTRYIYWVDGVAIKGERTDRADTILNTNTVIVANGVDDECISADEDVYNGGNRRLILIDVESGNLVERKSDDGITFV